jgi:hypothetical protein
MGILPLLNGYFPEGSFVWLTFCYSAGAKRSRNSNPNHFVERKNIQNFVILFRTIPQKIEMLEISFLNHFVEEKKKHLELRNFVPNPSAEDKNAWNSVLNHFNFVRTIKCKKKLS